MCRFEDVRIRLRLRARSGNRTGQEQRVCKERSKRGKRSGSTSSGRSGTFAEAAGTVGKELLCRASEVGDECRPVHYRVRGDPLQEERRSFQRRRSSQPPLSWSRSGAAGNVGQDQKLCWTSALLGATFLTTSTSLPFPELP